MAVHQGGGLKDQHPQPTRKIKNLIKKSKREEEKRKNVKCCVTNGVKAL